MPSKRPTLIASDSPVADEIQASVEQSSGRRFRRCTFDDCRQHLAWHKPGLVLLAAAASGIDYVLSWGRKAIESRNAGE